MSQDLLKKPETQNPPLSFSGCLTLFFPGPGPMALRGADPEAPVKIPLAASRHAGTRRKLVYFYEKGLHVSTRTDIPPANAKSQNQEGLSVRACCFSGTQQKPQHRRVLKGHPLTLVRCATSL